MADTTKIQWTDSTWNPITGCTLVDAGCDNCYAADLAATRLKNHPSREGLTRRNADGVAKFNGKVRFNEQWLDQPLRWRKPRMIFVCAHGDLFHPNVPDEWIDKVFAVMALCPHHTFQVLTKRPDRAREYLSDDDRYVGIVEEIGPMAWTHRGASHDNIHFARREKDQDEIKAWPLPNVWLGTSISDQASANNRVPDLLGAPAAVRFVSAEPLLGPVDMLVTDGRGHDISALRGIAVDPTDPEGADEFYRTEKIDWIIVGGESGKRARPMHPNWARNLRDQCQAAGTAYFFKQWGMWLPADQACPSLLDGSPIDSIDQWDWADADERSALYHWDDGTTSIHLRKDQAGRLLDGREWNGMPTVDLHLKGGRHGY